MLCAAFGALVLAGWHSGAIRLASAFIAGPPTGYLTGAAMLFAGLGMVAIVFGRPRLAVPGGALATLAGAVAIASRLFGGRGDALAIAGAGLLGAAWRESVAQRPVVPRWFPLVVGAAGATVSFVMWQALSADRLRDADATVPVPLTILVVGLGFTLLTALAVHWA